MNKGGGKQVFLSSEYILQIRPYILSPAGRMTTKGEMYRNGGEKRRTVHYTLKARHDSWERGKETKG